MPSLIRRLVVFAIPGVIYALTMALCLRILQVRFLLSVFVTASVGTAVLMIVLHAMGEKFDPKE